MWVTVFSFNTIFFPIFSVKMPSGSIINGRNQTLENDEPVAVVALANALLDMSVAVKDDSLVSSSISSESLVAACKSLFILRKNLSR